MTPEQALFQLRSVAAGILDRDGNALFGEKGAIVAADLPREQMARWPNNALFIKPGAEDHDKQSPWLSDAQIETLLFMQEISDPYGAEAVREVGRVQDLLIDAVMDLQAMAGVRCVPLRKSQLLPAVGIGMTGVYRGITWQASKVGSIRGASDRLPPVTSLAAVDAGSGDATLTWTRPDFYAYRYDYVGVIVRRKSGSAPTSITDGTSVQAATDNGGLTDSPGSGTWYYSAFVAYDQNEDAAADEYSPAASTSVVVA